MKKYYFDKLTDPNGNGDFFLIIEQSFWDQNHLWDDRGQGSDDVPPKFYEVTDSVFEYEGPYEEGRLALLAAGFVEHTMNADV